MFTKVDLEPGDFIVRYGALLTAASLVKDRSYAVQSAIDGVILNALKYRNMGGMINHCTKPNAELSSFMDKGAEQAKVVATEHIPAGTQILIDYSTQYFDSKKTSTVNLREDEDNFPYKINL